VKFIKQVFVVLILLCATNAFAEAVVGRDYTVLNPPQPTRSGNKIEVLEFFFYGCSHCFKLHPLLSAWEKKMPKDVQITYVPTVFRDSWESMAHTYYALEAMGQQGRLDDDLYNAWNRDNLDLSEESAVTDFVARHGVDGKKFSETYNSFSVQSKVTRSKQMMQTYGVRGTPTLVVDGKYEITGLYPADTMRVLDELVNKARKERAAKH
jgi:thiol:disulfide interchange protein DsbA